MNRPHHGSNGNVGSNSCSAASCRVHAIPSQPSPETAEHASQSACMNHVVYSMSMPARGTGQELSGRNMLWWQPSCGVRQAKLSTPNSAAPPTTQTARHPTTHHNKPGAHSLCVNQVHPVQVVCYPPQRLSFVPLRPCNTPLLPGTTPAPVAAHPPPRPSTNCGTYSSRPAQKVSAFPSQSRPICPHTQLNHCALHCIHLGGADSSLGRQLATWWHCCLVLSCS
jgi:hypothetical protein